MNACFNRHADVVDFLMKNSVKYKLNLNVKDDYTGNTAFHYACEEGNINIVRLMLEYAKDKDYQNNIDFALKNNDGKTGLQLATDPDIISRIDNFKKKMPHISI